MAEIEDRLLRIVFDVAVHSMDFGSGFLDDEEVAGLREQWERNSRDGYMEALPPLGALSKALGDDGFEAWAEGLEE